MSAASGKLRVRVIDVKRLNPDLIEKMWRLYTQSYDGATREQFDSDLSVKSGVFVGIDSGDNSFQGFSTYQIYEHNFDSKSIWIIFSGDTMIQPEYWGQTALHLAFARTLLRWRLLHPLRPCYWFMTVMGYRTYLVMARNFPNRYWPRYDTPTPPFIEQLISSLSRDMFGDAWDEQHGLILADASQGSLAEHIAPITSDIQAIPEVNFLVNRNPTYQRGDELACVAEVTLSDLLRGTSRLIQKRVRRYYDRSR
jgi:hypothetical protein